MTALHQIPAAPSVGDGVAGPVLRAPHGLGSEHDHARGWRAAVAVLLTCLLVTMGGWAALIGPSEVFIGPGPTPSSETTTTSAAPVDAVEELDRKDIEEREYGATTSIVANVSGGAIQLASRTHH